jgi:hypothetical protein
MIRTDCRLATIPEKMGHSERLPISYFKAAGA